MNKTELIFILDRSGSMSGLESDTIEDSTRPSATRKSMEKPA